MKLKRIKLKKLKNTRDLGGFPAADGKCIKEKKLIRSGHLAKASDRDKEILVNDYELRTVIDLRIDAEIKEKPEVLPEAVACFNFPLLDKSFLGIARDEYSIKSWFNLFKDCDRRPEDVFYDMYELLLFGERSKDYVRKIFDILLSQENGSVLWHCSAGKDRVGVVTMLILMALGVDRELIVEDFLATNRFSAGEIIKTRVFAPLVIRERRLRKCLAILMGVKREYMDKLFEKIDREFGDTFTFFEKQFAITEEEILLLREKYLVQRGSCL